MLLVWRSIRYRGGWRAFGFGLFAGTAGLTIPSGVVVLTPEYHVLGTKHNPSTSDGFMIGGSW